jgi:hypothetical protein
MVSLGLALLGLEGVYRFQLIDMYRPELVTYNPASLLTHDNRPTLLVMGDSFTASRTSYAGLLQETLREWRVVNAGVSGTGVLQALYMAPRRFARFRPALFLYQVYVGNDLFDLRYPLNWRTINPLRNLYWFFANHFRVVGYVNYRLRHLKETYWTRQAQGITRPGVAWAASTAPGFTVEQYDARVKTYLRAEPALVEDSVRVQGRRQQDYALLLASLTRLLAHCAPKVCQAYVLVIPHIGQVDEAFLTPMRQLGAHVTAPETLRLLDYPFLVGMREHFAAWSHVRVLNPLAMLRAQHTQHAVYFAHDEHLNAAGQQALATWVKQQLALQ